MNYRKIRNLRSKLELTQIQLAEKIGVQKETIKNWENGRATPNHDSRLRLAEVFFKNDMDAFNSYFQDKGSQFDKFPTEKTLLVDEFFTEKTLLENSNLNRIYITPLQLLLNDDNPDAPSISLCSFLGALRCSPVECANMLGALSSLIRNVSDIRTGAEAEMLFHDLIMRLNHIESNLNPYPSADFHREFNEILSDLKKSRITIASTSEQLDAIRRLFFFLYDYAAILGDSPDFYYMLSDIFIPLVGGTCTKDDRRRLFYILFDIAQRMTLQKEEKV